MITSCYGLPTYWALPVTGRCQGLAAAAPGQAMAKKVACSFVFSGDRINSTREKKTIDEGTLQQH